MLSTLYSPWYFVQLHNDILSCLVVYTTLSRTYPSYVVGMYSELANPIYFIYNTINDRFQSRRNYIIEIPQALKIFFF